MVTKVHHQEIIGDYFKSPIIIDFRLSADMRFFSVSSNEISK